MRSATACFVIVIEVILRFLMPLIYRELFMRLDQLALLVVDLLPEAQGRFLRVYFFEIAGTPSLPPYYFSPVAASAFRQVFPAAEFLLVLRSRAHGRVSL
jgi:uncharacterized protein YjeT (DUF2065 family)